LGKTDEIEKCLDQMVSKRLARKVDTYQGKMYIFESVALAIGEEWKSEIDYLKKRNQDLTKEINDIQIKIKYTDELRTIWIKDWKDPLAIFYISCIFFGQIHKQNINETREKNGLLSNSKRKLLEMQQKIDSSYNVNKINKEIK
jgi:hypothetical protein